MKSNTQPSLQLNRFVIVLAALVLAMPAWSQTVYEWRSEAANGNWHAPTHWWTGSASSAGFGVMRFSNNVHLNMTNNNSGITFNTHAIHFNSGNTSVRTLGGDAIRLFDFSGADPYILNSSSATHVINLNLRGDGDAGDPLLIRLDSTGGLTFNGTINNEGSNINVQGITSMANTVTLNGVISGSGGFLHANNNITTVFNAANTFTGTTTVEAGTIRLGQAGASFGGAASAVILGDNGIMDLNGHNTTVRYVSEQNSASGGTVALGGATLTIQDNGSTTRFQNSINGAGNVVYDAASTSVMSLYNSQGWTGSTTVKGGLLTSAGSMQTSSIIVEEGSFRVTGSDNRLAANPAVNLSGGTFNPRTNETIASIHSTGGTLEIEAGRTLAVANGGSIGASTGLRGGTLGIQGDTLEYRSTDTGNTTALAIADATMIIPDTVAAYASGISVASGSLLVNGELGGGTVQIGDNGSVGGIGLLTSDLALSGLATLHLADLLQPLTIHGNITFGPGFGIHNLAGIDWDDIELGPHTIITSNQDFSAAGLANYGFDQRVQVGTLEREAYFQNGSLQIVVIPEPATALLGGFGMLLLLLRLRRLATRGSFPKPQGA